MARKARSLETLLLQVNAAFPDRAKQSDGWIASADHLRRSPNSDHNPNQHDVVCALDLTHDPGDFDAHLFAEYLRKNRDPRLNYVISNRRIASTKENWAWRKYSGTNPHSQHIHISVHQDSKLYDDPRRWEFDDKPAPAPVPKPIPTPTAWHDSFAQSVLKWEGKFDRQGKLQIHRPAAGMYEVGGITSNNHPQLAARLAQLVNAGNQAQARREVMDFILKYTKEAQEWTDSPAVELFLRDTIYNRGPKAAAKILQKAVGTSQDGVVGPLTEGAAAKIPPAELIKRLKKARIEYELEVWGKREKYWKGLNNRWNNAEAEANKLLGISAKEDTMPVNTTPVVVPANKTEPAAIPWFQSPTFTGAGGGSLAAALTAYLIYNPSIPLKDNIVGPFGLAAFGALSAGWAALKRFWSEIQPITGTQRGADIIVANQPPIAEVQTDESDQTFYPVPTVESTAPVSIRDKSLADLETELPDALETLARLAKFASILVPQIGGVVAAGTAMSELLKERKPHG
jgi:lysozyme family protein